MKPYFAKSGAWVNFETLTPSGYYLVTLYDPAGNVVDKVQCDCSRDAREYRRVFVGIANHWGKRYRFNGLWG
jgi:hypothetical protein